MSRCRSRILINAILCLIFIITPFHMVIVLVRHIDLQSFLYIQSYQSTVTLEEIEIWDQIVPTDTLRTLVEHRSRLL